MPSYPGPNQAPLLHENQWYYLLQNETVVDGTASRAVQLRRLKGTTYFVGVSLEITFSGDPGTFAIDIQTADNDLASKYVTIDQAVGALNADFVTRIELPSFWAKFLRVNVVTLTNPVNVTVLVTR